MKCAVSDFDRTFSMDGAVSRENREAVRRWQQAGHWFVIATGRNEASLRKKLAEDPELGAVRPDVPGEFQGAAVPAAVPEVRAAAAEQFPTVAAYLNSRLEVFHRQDNF